jgi:hypothetical protein
LGFASTGSGVTIRIQGNEDVVAAALVGADGINSAVAGQLCGPLGTTYSGYVAWRAIAEMAYEPDDGQIWACLVRGREVGWLPVGDRRTYWFATTCLPEGQALAEGDKAYLLELLEQWPDPIPELIANTPPEQLTRSDIVDRQAPSIWGDGPVTLLGDAAHPMRPHLGQGGCQAIEDAAALALSLVEFRDHASAFRRYERQRRRRLDMLVARSGVSLRVNRLATGKLGDKLLDAPAPGVGTLRCGHPVEDGVPVGRAQFVEHGLRARVPTERCGEVRRHLDCGLAVVGSVPGAVSFRSGHCVETGASHTSLFDELGCDRDVAFRPCAPRPSGSERPAKRAVVAAAEPPVDPSEAQRLGKGLVVA